MIFFKSRTKELEAKIDNLTQLIDKLEKKHNQTIKLKDQEIQSLQRAIQNQGIRPKISIEKIQDFVDKLMENPDINVRFIPDFAEKKLYKNVLKMLLSIINEIVSETKIEILGHNILLNVTS